MREKPSRFGASGDYREAERLARLMGPEMRRTLTGEPYSSAYDLLEHLSYRAARWLYSPTMTRLVEAAASALLDDDNFGRLTDGQIDRVLTDALPNWSLYGRGRLRW